MYKRVSTFAAALTLSATVALSGCGTYVPDLQEFYQSKTEARLRVYYLVEHIECEVITSVQSVLLDDEDQAAERKAHGQPEVEVLEWLKKWAAQITLTLSVEEKTSLNPSLTLNRYFPTIPVFSDYKTPNPVNVQRIFNLGLAAAFSTDATRKETLSLYLDFKNITAPDKLKLAREQRDTGQQPNCNPTDGVFIDGDLKFKDWLYDATLPAAVQGGIIGNYSKALAAEEAASKKDVLSHEVTFVIIYGGNVTPTWKLVDVAANTGSLPFLAAQRTNTQDAIITLGPAQGTTLSVAAQNTILASQIGIAVANALRNSQQ
jgi:hypothetical protein